VFYSRRVFAMYNVDALLAKSEIYEIEEYDAVFYESPNSQSALEKLR